LKVLDVVSDHKAQGEGIGGLLKDPLILHRSQQQNIFPVTIASNQMIRGDLGGDSEKTLRDETFDEWRSTFTTVVLVSMIDGIMISALRNQEVW